MITGVRNHSGLSAVSVVGWSITHKTTKAGIKKESSLIDFALGAGQRWMKEENNEKLDSNQNHSND